MASNTPSINQIVAIFRDISVRSKFINSFGFGKTSDLNADQNILYPILWVEPTRNTARDSGSNQGYRNFSYGFNLYVLDRIDKGDSNYQELLSDCQYNLSTVIAEIEQHIFYIQNNLSLTEDINYTPVQYEYDDNTNGYMAEIKLRVPLRYTPCNNPIENITGFTVSLNSDITQYRLIGSQGPQGFQGYNGSDGANSLTWTNGVFTSPGYIGFDANGYADITQIFVNVVNNLSIDSTQWLEAIKVGDTIQLRNRNNSSFGTYIVDTISDTEPFPGVKYFTVIAGVCNGLAPTDGTSEIIFSYSSIGNIGSTGPTGSNGFQGSIGYQGLIGFQGSQGFGVQGVQGVQGINGVQGLQGTQGPSYSIGYTPSNDDLVVHLAGNETITGIKTFNNNVLLGTTTYDYTNNRLDFSGATANGRIRLNSAGTTVADSIQWGDIAIYRGTTNALYVGQLNTATRHLRISPQATGTSIITGGSSTTPILSFATTQANTSVLGIGGADNNIVMTFNPLSGTMSQSGLSMTQTWNTSGNPSCISLNVTNTASGLQAKFLDFLLNGTSVMSIAKSGSITSVGHLFITNTINTTSGQVNMGGAGLSIESQTGGLSNSAGRTLRLKSNLGTVASDGVLVRSNASLTATSGTQTGITIDDTFAPTSGTAVFNTLSISPTINQTGGANGIVRGVYVNPTITAGADVRGVEVTNGSIILPYTSSVTTYSIKTSDYLVNITGVVNTTLPTAVGVTGKTYIIKNTAAGSVTVNTTSSQTIDGSTTYSLGSQYKYVKVVSDGSNWLIIGNN